MKSPATIIKFGVIALLLFGVTRALLDSNNPGGPAPDSDAPKPAPRLDTPASNYAMRPLDNSWPLLAAEQEAKREISKNLLATNYYVVLDGSGSMRDVGCSGGRPKMEVAREALMAFAATLPPEVNLGLIAFDNSGVLERVPLGANNSNRFAQAVAQVAANRATPLRSAIGEAYQKLASQARRQLGYGEYHLVTLTDGQASPDEEPTPVVNQVLEQTPIVFHTIGFCIGDNHPLNQPGRTHYMSATDPQALDKGLQDVLAEAPSFAVDSFNGKP